MKAWQRCWDSELSGHQVRHKRPITMAHPLGHYILAVLFTLATCATAIASEFEFELGHWAGKSEKSQDGKIEGCLVSVHNRKNELLILRLGNDHGLTLGLFEKTWHGRAPRAVSVTILVDHTVFYSGLGLLRANDALAIRADNTAEALRVIGNGTTLLAQIGEQSVYFNLADANKAINFMLKCFKKNGLGQIKP